MRPRSRALEPLPRAARVARVLATLLAIAASACGETRGPAERGGASDSAGQAAESSSKRRQAGQTGQTGAPRDAGESGVALAITIDDLPWVGPLPPGWDRLEGNRRIMAALAAHGAPAAGFVNCGRVSAGAPVPVSYTHLTLPTTPYV